jgi:CHAD domain-containing protein/HD superfamily phosphodiesterase
MQRVLEELDKASQDFAPDPVHDLRVAIRRCRSMAEGFRSVDPDRTWNRMRKAAKAMFNRLGELRDTQVLLEWVQKLGAPNDKAASALLDLFRSREQALKAEAAGTLQSFDSKQWKSWIKILSERAARVPLGSPVFEYLALERWEQAHELHRRALRNRSKVAFHRLRIGLKKFRYIVENFLPDHHRQWGNDLKELQDALGEVHDLDVLWTTAWKSRIFTNQEARSRWQTRIAEQRQQRIQKYRNKMVGKNSLWPIWRMALPRGERLDHAILAKLKTWTSFLDPNPEHTQRVAKLALQLYDGMVANAVWNPSRGNARILLDAAALMHEVGRAKADKDHHKISARLIRKTGTPLGWAAEDLQMAALIARYHRGALPTPKALAGLPRKQWPLTKQLAGILRLADALDAAHDGRIQRIQVKRTHETMVLYADGYSADNPLAEKIAAARCLLESTLGFPIWVRALTSEQG